MRLHEALWAYRGECSFASDYFCPDPALMPEGACDERVVTKVSCREAAGADAGASELPPGGSPGQHSVESFVGKRADGSCTRYPAHWASPAGELPLREAVPCASTATMAAP